MPLTLPPISRRRFLAGSLAAGAGLWSGRLWAAAEHRRRDPHRFALLSDTHVAGDRTHVERGTNMADNLRKACAELLKLEPLPAAALVCGDCAFRAGLAEDYTTLIELLGPARAAGLPVHLALGNHDHRDRLWAALPDGDEARAKPLLKDRQVLRVESPRADWYVLDSLDVTNGTPGTLGAAQVAWLAENLDSRRDKPALVMVHHNPDERANPTGLTDTKALLDVLASRRQVKALVFGHTHDWSVTKTADGLHRVNLPPTAYVFGEGKPSGWVDVRVNEGGAMLELRCVDAAHKHHGQKAELAWRGDR
jgi:3',5'-cyclic AMP phosphodiesterase CpdA